MIEIREFKKEDISRMIYIWNEVVEEGIAFPQEDLLDEQSGLEFFAGQSFTGLSDKGKGAWLQSASV